MTNARIHADVNNDYGDAMNVACLISQASSLVGPDSLCACVYQPPLQTAANKGARYGGHTKRTGGSDPHEQRSRPGPSAGNQRTGRRESLIQHLHLQMYCTRHKVAEV